LVAHICPVLADVGTRHYNISMHSLSESILAAGRAAPFDLVGISGVGEYRELDFFPEWIAEGRAGEMNYLSTRNEAGELKRSRLANVAPWARSVVVCAINYNSAQPYSIEATDRTRGWISRYAWSESDYHDVILARLRHLESEIARLVTAEQKEFRSWCYVDTGPLVERIYAKYAGIGWIAKNTCIINQQLGSWLFLGVILTSLELAPSLPAEDRCGTCTACLDACPTEAFIDAYKLDASRCISYLTIEKRGTIPEELRAGMGRHLFGCDICQDVCPWNRRAAVSTDPEFTPRPALVTPSLATVAEMAPEEFRETFRGSPVKRAKYAGLRRNAAIAMGNSGDLQFLPQLQRLADDPDSTVAEHARWALKQLRENSNEPGRHLESQTSGQPSDSTAQS
jgi:epoxyqueuosine reductase